jgi:hypothetical protein
VKKFVFPLTPRQIQLVESQARFLVCGAGTKTGKSVAFYVWLINGLLAGDACVFIGPFFFRSRAAFDQMKILLQPLIADRFVRVNEARLQMNAVGGGYIDFLSADNPQNLFGANYKRVVLDEASRMPEMIYSASLTTITATRGKLRMAFNLDLGQKNWAIRHLLRIQKMGPEEREKASEAYMCFPSGGDGLVSDEVIAQFRTQMDETTWRALYLAEIPESDCSLFHNLDEIFTGRERHEPEPGKAYFLGIDLARKADYTVLTIIDSEGRVCCSERYTRLDWSLQVGRAAILYRKFQCAKAIVDSTGLGDPVCEQLEEMGLNVERYTFSSVTRKALILELVLACDNKEIQIPSSLTIYRQEMESFEFVLDGESMRYEVPSGCHDDTTMSLALAVHGFRAGRGAILGVVLLVQRRAKEIADGIRDRFGDLVRPKPKPVVVSKAPAVLAPVVRSEAPEKKPNDPCENCGSTSTVWQPGGAGIAKPFVLRCNQCQAIDGVLPASTDESCPNRKGGHDMSGMAGGRPRCQACGYQPGTPVPQGCSFRELNARANLPFRGMFERRR